jgi:hypothetical protein
MMTERMVEEAIVIIKDLCGLPEALHPVAEKIMRDVVAGNSSVLEFKRMFHMANSEYLDYVNCIIKYLE